MKTPYPYVVALVSALMWYLPAQSTWSASDQARELAWEELMPENWRPFDPWTDLSESQIERLSNGSPEEISALQELIKSKSAAPVVAALNGQRVRIPGYVVPLDFQGTEVTEFLLVPYFGACIHVPPPPANQIVFVKTREPFAIDGLFTPVWVTGKIHTEAFENMVGDAGYTLNATTIEPYQ